MQQGIAILGSTGSIGMQALDVIDNLGDEFRVVALAAKRNVELLYGQILGYTPKIAAIMDEDAFEQLQARLKDHPTKLVCGMDGLIEAATLEEASVVLNSVVGSIGLAPTMAAIDAGKTIALANKETIVAGGEIVVQRARERGVRILPIDSEHSAILQCLAGNSDNKVHKIYLTASGGPFRGKTAGSLRSVTPDQALKHPNWIMGPKITIDSATLMNKGLEVIEAKWLFGLRAEQIEVVVHPQSIIHSMVEFEDGAIIAQLGESDMRVAIQYALTYPRRVRANYRRLDIVARGQLTFERPNTANFPCLPLAYDALKIGGSIPAVLNAANEVAVQRFLRHEIAFTDIPKQLKIAMNAYTEKIKAEGASLGIRNIQDILAAEEWARNFVSSLWNSSNT